MKPETAAFLAEKQQEVNSIVNGTIAELQATESPYLQTVAARFEQQLAELNECTARQQAERKVNA